MATDGVFLPRRGGDASVHQLEGRVGVAVVQTDWHYNVETLSVLSWHGGRLSPAIGELLGAWYAFWVLL